MKLRSGHAQITTAGEQLMFAAENCKLSRFFLNKLRETKALNFSTNNFAAISFWGGELEKFIEARMFTAKEAPKDMPLFPIPAELEKE